MVEGYFIVDLHLPILRTPHEVGELEIQALVNISQL